jgi:hypothetical protein
VREVVLIPKSTGHAPTTAAPLHQKEAMTVRAKMKCEEKRVKTWGEGITLVPVTSGSEENKAFFKSSPAGKVELDIVNKAAADQFEVGKEYYVDFTPA